MPCLPVLTSGLRHVMPGNFDWALRDKLRRHTFANKMEPAGYVINTACSASLALQLPVTSCIEATSFAHELRRLAERFPALLPEARRAVR